MRLYGTLAELSSLTIRLASGKTVQVAAAEPTASAVVVTIPDVADGSDTFVMVDTTQTLTNKTLSSPVLTIANIEATRLVIPKLSDPAITRDQGTLILDSDTNLVTVGEGGGTAYKVLVDETTAQTLQNKTLSSPTISGGAITGSVLGSDLNPVTITHADKIALGKITDVSANHVLISDANNEVYSEAQLSKSRGGTGADLSDVVFPANVPSTIQTDIAELTSLKVDRAAPVITGGILAPSASKEVIQRIATAANFNEISSPEDGRYFILMNASGSDITIGNETGTAANQIVTGTGAAFTFKNGTSLAAVYDGGSSKWRLSGGAGGAGGGTADVISQVAHGFSVGQAVWIDPLDGAYKKAQADAANTAEVVGVVSKVVSVDAFELTLSGEISGLTGLEPGEVYFLSAATAGALTKVEPSVVGQVSLPVGVASSATSLYVLPKRGVVVGGANLRTQIGLNGAAFVNQTTNIQNVSAYDAGELSGWVYIDATTDRRFYIQAQFVKDASNAWRCAYQTTGDTPPAGFNVDVISSGPDAFVQVQMPPVAGWVSGNVNFGLNVPAVGATLPLQISGSLVTGPVLGAGTGAAIPAGYVFEQTSTHHNFTITNNAAAVQNITSFSLNPGVWMVESSCNFRSAEPGTTGWNFAAIAIADANNSTAGTNQMSYTYAYLGHITTSQYYNLMTKRYFNITSTTTFYLNTLNLYVANNPTVACTLVCTRLN